MHERLWKVVEYDHDTDFIQTTDMCSSLVICLSTCLVLPSFHFAANYTSCLYQNKKNIVVSLNVSFCCFLVQCPRNRLYGGWSVFDLLYIHSFIECVHCCNNCRTKHLTSAKTTINLFVQWSGLDFLFLYLFPRVGFLCMCAYTNNSV